MWQCHVCRLVSLVPTFLPTFVDDSFSASAGVGQKAQPDKKPAKVVKIGQALTAPASAEEPVMLCYDSNATQS